MLILANMFAVPGSNHIVIYIIPSLFVCLPVCPAAYCILNSNYRECPHGTFPNECNQCACRLQYNLPTDCKDLALPLAGIQTVYRVKLALPCCPYSWAAHDLRLYSPRDGSSGHACASGCDVCVHVVRFYAWNDTHVHRLRPAIKERKERESSRLKACWSRYSIPPAPSWSYSNWA